jgi:hydroxymethylglutaryl-CoA reductase (NADPH)
MSISIDKAEKIFRSLQENGRLEGMFHQLKKNTTEPNFRFPKNEYSERNLQERLQVIQEETNTVNEALTACNDHTELDALKGNIENFIGFTQVPTGIAGPLRVNGSEAKGDFMVPLATTEGALVASYHRGAKATLLSGGISTVCLTEGVKRSPLFGFESMEQGIRFSDLGNQTERGVW